MWKLLVGFIVSAAVALFVMKKTGADVDMGGEKHDVSGGGHAASAPAPAPASAPASAPAAAPAPASAASN